MKLHAHSAFIISMPDAHGMGIMTGLNIKRARINKHPYGHLMNHQHIIGLQINKMMSMPTMSAIQHLSAISPRIGVIPVTGIAVKRNHKM